MKFSLVNRRPNKPKLTFSLYKFKQDRTLEKSLLPYRNLFIILETFQNTSVSSCMSHSRDEESMMLYDFSSVFDFVREYHHAVCKGGCRRVSEVGDKPND